MVFKNQSERTNAQAFVLSLKIYPKLVTLRQTNLPLFSSYFFALAFVALAPLAGAALVLAFFAVAVLLPPPLLLPAFACGAEVVFEVADTVIFAPFAAGAALLLLDAEAVLAPPLADDEDFAPFAAAPPLFAFEEDLFAPPATASAIAPTAPPNAPKAAPVAVPIKISPAVPFALSKMPGDERFLAAGFLADVFDAPLLPPLEDLLLADLLLDDAAFLVVDFPVPFFAAIIISPVSKLL